MRTTAFSESCEVNRRFQIIIDAGHGLPDGGALSCTGKPESEYNLEIAFRLQDVLQLMGFETVMTRNSENSVYTEGATIAQKKKSDLDRRLYVIDHTEHPIFISIHQNHFPDDRYHGAVILYADSKHSKSLAQTMQDEFIRVLNPSSNRSSMPAKGIYLLENLSCPGILIECGFLSNPVEEAALRDPVYQKQIACVIAGTLAAFLSDYQGEPSSDAC